MKKRTQQGFTLYELLITFLVVGVVLTLGIPNMKAFTQNSRMTSTANELLAAFQQARSESARAKADITICASADPYGAALCDGTWDQGYVVFTDDDKDGTPDATDGDTVRQADEHVLYAHGAVATGVSLAVANDARYFSFAATGLGRGDVGGVPAMSQVIMCDERGNITAAGGNSAARLFVTTPLGRATIVRDLDRITTAISSTSLPCP
jgi:type IV fimbrial biogenesis protein FimT